MRGFSAVMVLLAFALAGCAATPTPTAVPTPMPTAPVTPSVTQPPSAIPTLAVSPSPTVAPTLQSTPSPATLPPSPTPSLTPPSPTPTQPPTPTPTAAPTPTPTSPPASSVELKGACISMVNEPYEEFDRYVMLDASFEETNIQAIQVAISGANDDQPAEGYEPLPGIWQVTLGLNQGTQSSDLSFISADVTVGGEVESFLAALAESIGDMSQLRPGRSVGESCGGF